MVVIDKPHWIRHDGAIFGVDIDAPGERLATCGADSRIRIWSMRPVLLESAELDAAVPKILATLIDSIHPVNCVRFAPAARLLAAGTDDSDTLVYELREGRGQVVFGSSEGPNLENWRLKCRLRGHESTVADVAWAPDSRRLATASLDNRVKIWDSSSGHCIRTLEGHVGFVKGVAWDPFDFFLASQGEREVIVWRLEDGAVVTNISEPFKTSPNVSFGLRLAWSPDGQVLAAPNGFDNGMHTVPLLRRNHWAPFETCLAGHRGSATAVRYNPHLFFPRKKQPPQQQEGGGSGAGGSAAGGGGAADGREDDAAGGITAVGATDKMFTLWHPVEDEPLMVGKGFFKSMINDLAWSPDGRVLVTASQDGSVTTAVFGEDELGRRVPDVEVAELHRQLYGDPRVRSQKTALTAAPDLLQLEADARTGDKQDRLNSRLGPGPGAAGPAVTAANSGLRPPASTVSTLANGSMPAAPAPVTSAAEGLPPRPPVAPPGGGGSAAGGTQSASPAKTVVQPPSGRGSGRDPDQPPAKRPALQPMAVPPQIPRASGAVSMGATRSVGPSSAGVSAVTAMGSTGAPGAMGVGSDAATAGQGAGAPAAVLVPHEPVKPLMSKVIHVQPSVNAERPIPLELQALNTTRDARQRAAAEVVCMAGPRRLWQDSVQGQVVAMAGNNRLAAVATTMGDLLIYSTAGRRLYPPIRLSAPPSSFLFVAPDSTLVMALLADGQMRVWDFATGEQVLETSVAPLLLGSGQQQPLRVSLARLLASGCPMVVLSNAHGYVHHSGLRCWMRVVDDAFPASVRITSLTAAPTGDLARLQAEVAQRRTPREVLDTSQMHAARPAFGARSEQALLEHNLAAAAALQSPNEWRLWLLTYVRRLATDEDETRLRDLISELLGPVRWSPATHPTAAPTSATAATGSSGASTSGRGAAGSQWEPALASSVVGRWQPTILGFDKRKLLRDVVLKEVNRNRALQQLVAEVLDQLKYIDGAGPPTARPGGGATGCGTNGGGNGVGNGAAGAAAGAAPGPGNVVTAPAASAATGLEQQPEPMVTG